MEREEIATLLHQLSETFGHLPIPPAECIVLGDCAHDLEAREVQSKFRGRHWLDLSSEDLCGESDSLSFFTPEAFRFFLPAFIRASLLDPKTADQIPDAILWNLAGPADLKSWEERRDLDLGTARAHAIPEILVLDLAPTENSDLDNFREKRVAALTYDQRQVVIKFIRFLRTHRPAGDYTVSHLDRAENALR